MNRMPAAQKMQITIDILGPLMRALVARMFQVILSDPNDRAVAMRDIAAVIESGLQAQFAAMRNDPQFANAVIDGSLSRAEAGSMAQLHGMCNAIAGTDVFGTNGKTFKITEC
jgi:hypothetical protein